MAHIDVTDRDNLRCAAVAKMLDVSPQSVYRYMLHGLRGVRLHHTRIGNKLVTNRASVQEFCDRLAELDRIGGARCHADQVDAQASPDACNQEAGPSTSASASANAAQDQASAELDAAGIN